MIAKAVYFSHTHRVRLVFEPTGAVYMDIDHLAPSDEVESMLMHANVRGYRFAYDVAPVETHKRFLRHPMRAMDGSTPAAFEDLFTQGSCGPDCLTCRTTHESAC